MKVGNISKTAITNSRIITIILTLQALLLLDYVVILLHPLNVFHLKNKPVRTPKGKKVKQNECISLLLSYFTKYS